ncbi:hypothetical protein Z965_09170 [Clostridium novyi A str. BKT29909]|uniref:hypothetical protein n=1 Tax=Clostridium novyi TaxID=1542 RepID=UPI0004D57024|nr:hypothetical protein [Clostridium novyi]KEH90976.1 hypothetical protein Z965_09170 [Clostridium novyi A str. BKT29909]
MDIILNSAGRKKLVSIGLRKIFAMIAYLTLEFILCTVICTTIIVGMFGASGWNCQIQILPKFFANIYNWSIGKMFINHFIIAWISILSVALIGAFINSIIQKNICIIDNSGIFNSYSNVFKKQYTSIGKNSKIFMCTTYKWS